MSREALVLILTRKAFLDWVAEYNQLCYAEGWSLIHDKPTTHEWERFRDGLSPEQAILCVKYGVWIA